MAFVSYVANSFRFAFTTWKELAIVILCGKTCVHKLSSLCNFSRLDTTKRCGILGMASVIQTTCRMISKCKLLTRPQFTKCYVLFYMCCMVSMFWPYCQTHVNFVFDVLRLKFWNLPRQCVHIITLQMNFFGIPVICILIFFPPWDVNEMFTFLCNDVLIMLGRLILYLLLNFDARCDYWRVLHIRSISVYIFAIKFSDVLYLM